jgi:hypothetical protein
MKHLSRSILIAAAIALVAVLGIQARATALSAARDTPMRDGSLLSLTIETGATIYAGGMVAITNGKAVAASDANGLIVVGRAEASGDAGDVINVRRGVFRWANGGSFTAANIGSFAYIADDQTVTTAGSATYDIIAGLIVDVDTVGVWVDTFQVPSQGAATLAALTVSGNAAVGGTLTATGNTTIGASKVVITAASGNIVSKGTLGAGANGTEFTVASTGNTVVGGTLSVTGTSALTGNVTASNVTASGSILLTGLPTATNGLANGALWSNSGAVSVYTE